MAQSLSYFSTRVGRLLNAMIVLILDGTEASLTSLVIFTSHPPSIVSVGVETTWVVTPRSSMLSLHVKEHGGSYMVLAMRC